MLRGHDGSRFVFPRNGVQRLHDGRPRVVCKQLSVGSFLGRRSVGTADVDVAVIDQLAASNVDESRRHIDLAHMRYIAVCVAAPIERNLQHLLVGAVCARFERSDRVEVGRGALREDQQWRSTVVFHVVNDLVFGEITSSFAAALDPQRLESGANAPNDGDPGNLLFGRTDSGGPPQNDKS